jgi:hypothetical protein
VKLVKADAQRLSFEIGRNERLLLFQLLALYPMIPAHHQLLSRGEARPEDQAMLEAALAAQRAQNKRRLDKMMKAATRFRRCRRGWRFSLRRTEAEGLLQVLNDIRVGAWIRLGCPDPPGAVLTNLDARTTPVFWAMEVAGRFQMALLHALGGGETGPAESSSGSKAWP